MQIGAKIYYDKATGSVLVNTGWREGDVVETSQEQDFRNYVALAERTPDTVGCLQLEYKQYEQDFSQCNGYRVNPDTVELEFSYPDPSAPKPQEPVYQTPLTDQVAELKTAVAELTMMIAAGQPV